MLKNFFEKLIGNSKLVIASLMAIPMMTVLLIFILSHALFTPEQPSTDEIINSLTHKAKLGGIDLASLGIEIDLGDNETDNETQEQGYVVTEKADGIRAQLYINPNDSKGYLVTPKREVFDTGTYFDTIESPWVFDGEYITKNKMAKISNYL